MEPDIVPEAHAQSVGRRRLDVKRRGKQAPRHYEACDAGREIHIVRRMRSPSLDGSGRRLTTQIVRLQSASLVPIAGKYRDGSTSNRFISGPAADMRTSP